MTHPIQEAVALLNVKIRFRSSLFAKTPARVRALAADRDLSTQQSDGEIVVMTAGILEYDVIEIS